MELRTIRDVVEGCCRDYFVRLHALCLHIASRLFLLSCILVCSMLSCEIIDCLRQTESDGQIIGRAIECRVT